MTSPVTTDETHVLAKPAPEPKRVVDRTTKGNRRRRPPPKRPFTSGHASQSTILPQESKRQLLDSAFLTAPIYDSFPIFISLRGLHSLCLHMHENLKIRDRHLYNTSVTDMFYSALQCAILKIMRCDASSGRVDSDLPLFEMTFSNVMFPSIIADYLDSIGRFTMSNGVTVAPSLRWIKWKDNQLINDMPTYVKKHFLHPAICFDDCLPEWLRSANSDVVVPFTESGYCTAAKWLLMPDVVERYCRLIPRMMKSVEMRVPNPSCEGQSNIVVCRRTHQRDSVCGMAPQVLTDEAAHIGAVFGWNYYEERRTWPGDREILIPLTAGVMFSLSNATAKLVRTRMKLFRSD